MIKNPNIERFNQLVRDLGVKLDDPRLSERQLFKAYSEGRKPELDKILLSEDQIKSDADQIDDMDVALHL